MSRVLLEKLTGSQLVKKFTFHRTRKFITALTRARHLSLALARSIQSMPPYPTSWRSIFIFFPSTPGFCKWSPTFRFPCQNPVCTSPLPHTSCPTHLILLQFIIRVIFGEDYRQLSTCSLLHSSVTSLPLGPNIFLSAPFSNTCSLRPSVNVSDQVSHPYKSTS